MKTADKAIQTTLSLVEEIFGSSSIRNFAIQLWGGTVWKPEPAEPTAFTMVLQYAGALHSMFLPPTELNMAEAYVYNDYDIVGDIETFVRFGFQFLDASWGKMARLRYGARPLSLPNTSSLRLDEATVKLRGERHSRERDQQAIQYHYSRSNDFFALFLDPYMVYSCAYFLTPDGDLDTAQERKLDYICRKLRLRPGERLLDIGCGWGGLIIYAAQVRDVENLREHYVYTLRHWIHRLEERADEAKKIAGELTYRIWRLYLSVGLHKFEVGTTHLYQTLLVKSEKGKSGLPLTREDWYAL